MPDHQGDFWLSSNGHLLHSSDAGDTLSEVTSVDNADKVGFGKAPLGKDYPAIYINGTVGKSEGIFRSDDSGKSWVHINDDQHNYGYLNVVIGDPRVFGRVYIGTSGRGIIYGDSAEK